MCHEVHMVLTLALWDGCSCIVALYLMHVHGMICPYNLCSCTSSLLNMARCVAVTSKLPVPALDQSCLDLHDTAVEAKVGYDALHPLQ